MEHDLGDRLARFWMVLITNAMKVKVYDIVNIK
jgi:hypothetical protein